MLVIVDYGVGNLASIANMLKKAGHDAHITGDHAEILSAEKLILPGVGAFDNGMQKLRAQGLEPVLNQRVLKDRVPVLGICLGLQIMTRDSEEGREAGLGWLDAHTVKFQITDPGLKVPHMGWNDVELKRDSPLFHGMEGEKRFYFVHSYHLRCDREADVLATSVYGYPFVCAAGRDNIWGVQFHPEKSHRFGMQLLKNFAERCG